MLRAVLAVALAVALLAASLPAIDRAQHDHADSQVRSQLERLVTVARALAARNDPVPVGNAGATRTLTLRLPARGWRSAGVAYVAIGGVPGNATTDTSDGDVLAWRLTGGPPRVVRVEDIAIHTISDGRVAPDGRPLVVRESGRHRVELSLVRHRGRPVVLVRRFKSEDGTNPGRARGVRAKRGQSVPMRAGVRRRPPGGRRWRVSGPGRTCRRVGLPGDGRGCADRARRRGRAHAR